MSKSEGTVTNRIRQLLTEHPDLKNQEIIEVLAREGFKKRNGNSLEAKDIAATRSHFKKRNANRSSQMMTFAIPEEPKKKSGKVMAVVCDLEDASALFQSFLKGDA